MQLKVLPIFCGFLLTADGISFEDETPLLVCASSCGLAVGSLLRLLLSRRRTAGSAAAAAEAEEP